MTTFDAYHQWLGISPKDQPPHHYRLLGIDLFEHDLNVIDRAANRQMSYLHDLGAGEHQELAQGLLNELSAARVCLLDPETRAKYDDQLKRSLEIASQEKMIQGPGPLPEAITPALPHQNGPEVNLEELDPLATDPLATLNSASDPFAENSGEMQTRIPTSRLSWEDSLSQNELTTLQQGSEAKSSQVTSSVEDKPGHENKKSAIPLVAIIGGAAAGIALVGLLLIAIVWFVLSNGNDKSKAELADGNLSAAGLEKPSAEQQSSGDSATTEAEQAAKFAEAVRLIRSSIVTDQADGMAILRELPVVENERRAVADALLYRANYSRYYDDKIYQELNRFGDKRDAPFVAEMFAKHTGAADAAHQFLLTHADTNIEEKIALLLGKTERSAEAAAILAQIEPKPIKTVNAIYQLPSAALAKLDRPDKSFEYFLSYSPRTYDTQTAKSAAQELLEFWEVDLNIATFDFYLELLQNSGKETSPFARSNALPEETRSEGINLALAWFASQAVVKEQQTEVANALGTRFAELPAKNYLPVMESWGNEACAPPLIEWLQGETAIDLDLIKLLIRWDRDETLATVISKMDSANYLTTPVIKEALLLFGADTIDALIPHMNSANRTTWEIVLAILNDAELPTDKVIKQCLIDLGSDPTDPKTTERLAEFEATFIKEFNAYRNTDATTHSRALDWLSRIEPDEIENEKAREALANGLLLACHDSRLFERALPEIVDLSVPHAIRVVRVAVENRVAESRLYTVLLQSEMTEAFALELLNLDNLKAKSFACRVLSAVGTSDCDDKLRDHLRVAVQAVVAARGSKAAEKPARLKHVEELKTLRKEIAMRDGPPGLGILRGQLPTRPRVPRFDGFGREF